MDRPAEAAQLALIRVVAFPVFKQFWDPIGPIRLRNFSVAASMPVPEAALDLNDCAVFRQNNIRASWKIAHMQPEPEAEAV